MKGGGFDVVIGNPPYLRIQGLQEFYGYQIDYFIKNYQSAVKRFDLYLLFAERGFKLINKDSIRLSSDIKKKILFIKNGGCLDTKFILVSDKPSGPFTILEGNRRSVSLLSLNKLLGNRIYLGISEGIRNCKWSKYMYKNKH